MTKLEITPNQRRKLIILTKGYFPEFTSVNFDTHFRDFLILFQGRIRLKIHWFEWTMTHLSARLINVQPMSTKALLENWNWTGLFKNTHPIDLLYKEYLNATIN